MRAKRKPGPAKGTPAVGHRPATPPATLEQKALWVRWQVFPASLRPAAQGMSDALGMHRNTWHRIIKAEGAGLSDAQLTLAHALLDKAAPRVQNPPPDTLPTHEDVE